MIIVRFMGGLGNQMFQYALYRALVESGKKVKADLSWFDLLQVHNGYELENLFSINVDKATLNDCKQLGVRGFGLVQRIIRKISNNEKYFSQSVLEGISYNKDVFDYQNVYLEGYWQSEKYFEKIAEEIKNTYVFRSVSDEYNIEQEKIINKTNSVAIHVRRGDYLKTSIHSNICSLSYYKKAMEYILNIIDNPYFFIFSDDISWCKENLKIDNCTYILKNSGINSYKDMRLMSLCKHNIIANSSFSWWGAWLNNYNNKIVIAPNRWFNIKNSDSSDLIPENWIKIYS